MSHDRLHRALVNLLRDVDAYAPQPNGRRRAVAVELARMTSAAHAEALSALARGEIAHVCDLVIRSRRVERAIVLEALGAVSVDPQAVRPLH